MNKLIEYFHNNTMEKNKNHDFKRVMITSAFVFSEDFTSVSIGITKSNPNDIINKKLGNEIALDRAKNNPQIVLSFTEFKQQILSFLHEHNNFTNLEPVDNFCLVFLERLLYNDKINNFELVPVSLIYCMLSYKDIEIEL